MVEINCKKFNRLYITWVEANRSINSVIARCAPGLWTSLSFVS